MAEHLGARLWRLISWIQIHGLTLAVPWEACFLITLFQFLTNKMGLIIALTQGL